MKLERTKLHSNRDITLSSMNLLNEARARGVENNAAMDMGKTIDLVQVLTWVYDNVVLRLKPEETVERVDLRALRESVTLLDVNLGVSNNVDRDKAIHDVATKDIQNPNEVIFNLELALRTLIIYDNDLPLDSNHKGDHLDYLTGALEGLYSRTDVNLVGARGWHGGSPSEYVEPSISLTNESAWYGKDLATIASELLKTPPPSLNSFAQLSLERILVSNWNLPVEGIKLPDINEPIEYRLKLYKAISNLSRREDQDLLYLKTPLDKVPVKYREKVERYRSELVKALENEVLQRTQNIPNYSEAAIRLLESILSDATEIDQLSWNADANQTHSLRTSQLAGFRGWATFIPGVNDGNIVTVFDAMTEEQRSALSLANSLMIRNSYESEEELSAEISRLIDSLGSFGNDPQAVNDLFFLDVISYILEKPVIVGSGEALSPRSTLNSATKNTVLSYLRSGVYGYPGSQTQSFENPSSNAVNGKSLILYRKIKPGFSPEGTQDKHNLRNLVLQQGDRRLFGAEGGSHDEWAKGGSHDEWAEGILLSGDSQVELDAFIQASADEMALPVYTLDETSFSSNENHTVNDVTSLTGSEVPTSEYLTQITQDSPCILHLKAVENWMPPRETDESYSQEAYERALSRGYNTPENLQMAGRNIINLVGNDKRIVLFLSTVGLEADISDMNENGTSESLNHELSYRVSSGATAEGYRVLHKIFSYHNTEDETVLAMRKRISLIRSVVRSVDSEMFPDKSVRGTFDYRKLAKASEGLDEEKVRTTLLRINEVSESTILDALKKV